MGMFGMAMAGAFVARMAAQHIAVHGGDFVQHALLRPEIQSAVGGGRRNDTFAVPLHLRQDIIGLNHAVQLQHHIQHLLAQRRYLCAGSAALVQNLFFNRVHIFRFA